MNKFICLTIAFFVYFNCFSQINRPSFKLGNITAADLSKKVYSIDSNAQAIILLNTCEVKYEGNNSGFFNVVYKYHKKIHLLNKNAFDLATIYIPIFKHGNDEDKIEKLEAVTYTLNNGEIVKTKIDKSSIFKDKIRKNVTLYKFTFPNIKEGSIIEYAYTVNSPSAFHLREWEFQEQYPTIWSHYNTQIPSIYSFLTLRQGYNKFAIDSVGISQDTYYILFPGESAAESSTVGSIKLNTYNSLWAMQDIPALKKEQFTTTLENHTSKIVFLLSAMKYPNTPVKPVLANWKQVSEDLLKDEDYGLELEKKNNWLDDDLKKLIGSETDGKEKAKKMFAFVRDNFTCTSYDNLYKQQSIKDVFNSKKGTVVEINMLLTAMYRHLGFSAKPVLLSTRDNGFSSELYPIIEKCNYTICDLELGEEKILLDATHPKLGFGKLMNECYNGPARIINQVPHLISLSADSVKESKLTSIFIRNGTNGEMQASFSSALGQFESLETRQQLSKEKEEDFFNNFKKQYSFDITIKDKSIENLNEFEESLKINYSFTFKPEDDIIYFTPLLTEVQKNNPFIAEERYYPVEMPHTIAQTVVLNMETPNGYEIDEVPKSTRVKLNETDGIFEYLIAKTDNGIQLRSTIKINKANFTNDDYQTLRDFFAYVVKKHAEQIVYKKKK